MESDLGCYASDNSYRPALVAVARERAGTRYGVTFTRQNTVIVGDSLEDVVTGRAGGAALLGMTPRWARS